MRRARPSRQLAAGLSALVLLALVALGGPAQGTPPAQNGRIAFSANLKSTFQIYTMTQHGIGLQQLTHVSAPHIAEFPDWSADGTKIVYDSERSGAFEIYSMNADGSGNVRLGHEPGVNHAAPKFSPDGSKIVFASDTGISTMNADGTRVTHLTHDGGFLPEYSPDGANIAYMSSRGGFVSAIWVMKADGSQAHRLSPRGLEAGAPNWSPDGMHIVFINHVNVAGPNQIYVMNADGSQIRQLTHPGGGHHDVWPSFSPDGKKIVFASDRQYSNLCCLDIWTMNFDGSGLTQITSDLSHGGCEGDNCVNPDWGPKP